jgi:uncharacterized protein GlcG (DUF336 family)
MKTQHFFCCLAVLAVCFTACKRDKEEPEKIEEPTSIPVTGITLNYEERTLLPGDTVTLIATVQPDDADNKTVTWTSSNPDVATVNDDGFVEAIANGETIITATTQDGNKKATCAITVDYRIKWVGTYDFTTIDYIHYCNDPECISGVIEIWDTIQFIGTIGIFGTDKLKITFKPDATEPDLGTGNIGYWPLRINGIIYPVVDDTGNLTYLELINGSHHGMFRGSFSKNEINIQYAETGPLGAAAFENHTINGIKINK